MKATKIALIVCIAAAGNILGAPPSLATTGPTFGHHVSDCAMTVGFTGTHNPGMHQGAAGWDGATCAP
jgi:hypothetical protein